MMNNKWCPNCGFDKFKKHGKHKGEVRWECLRCHHRTITPLTEEPKDIDWDGRKELLNILQKNKLNPNETDKIIAEFRRANTTKYKTVNIGIPDRHICFGSISDLHIGHKCYRPDILDFAVKKFKEYKCDFVVNSGDTIEGMSGRDGHIYELIDIGYTAQIARFRSEFEKLSDFKVYSIEAQDSHSGWFHSKGNMGLDIGDELSKNSKAYQFIGYDEQDIRLDNGLIIRLNHPGGGTAYALSYKGQKYIESLSGGKKPHIIFQGHFHKALYLYYRNIHFFGAACMQEQTIFMKKKNTPSMLGFWIIESWYDKTGWSSELSQKFFPFYE
jgi:ribosomal protein S27AE